MKALGPPSLSWVTTKNLEDVEVLDVQVGPGRLGVVLENNPFVAPGEKGPPIFASIKDSSVVTNMILPNDALVRVDDEDCTQLDAIHVSKLIKRKQNSFRKFTIVRNHHNASGSDSISGESTDVSDLGADVQERRSMKETSPT
jgi:C-terminal processing protease CtpA/Prc